VERPRPPEAHRLAADRGVDVLYRVFPEEPAVRRRRADPEQGMGLARAVAGRHHARHHQHPHGRDARTQSAAVAADRSRQSPQMTTRIDQRFADLAREGRSGLVTFTMAGDPDPKTALAILKALPKAGAD